MKYCHYRLSKILNAIAKRENKLIEQELDRICAEEKSDIEVSLK